MKAFSLLLEKQANKPTNQTHLKSWVHKEGFFSIIIASRMQCILPKGSQLSSSKEVYVRNTAKTNTAWSCTNPGWFARLSPISQVNDAVVSQLHTPAGWVSSSAVLYPWSWLSLQRVCSWLWDHCPSLPGEQKPGSAGKRGLSHSCRGGTEKGRRFKCEEHWVGKIFLLAFPSRSHFPASPQPPSISLNRWVSHGWRMGKANADDGSWFSARDLHCLCLSSALRAALCVWLEFCDSVSGYPSLKPDGCWSSLHGPEVGKKKKC